MRPGPKSGVPGHVLLPQPEAKLLKRIAYEADLLLRYIQTHKYDTSSLQVYKADIEQLSASLQGAIMDLHLMKPKEPNASAT